MHLVYGLLDAIALAMLSDFVLRGLVPAFEPAKTNFSELYTSAWLWRHGQNFYNSAIATVTQVQLVGVSVRVAPPIRLVLSRYSRRLRFCPGDGQIFSGYPSASSA